jgi:hypothetical protein
MGSKGCKTVCFWIVVIYGWKFPIVKINELEILVWGWNFVLIDEVWVEVIEN